MVKLRKIFGLYAMKKLRHAIYEKIDITFLFFIPVNKKV